MSKNEPDWEDQIRLFGPRRAVVFGSGMLGFPEEWVSLSSLNQEVLTGLEKSKIPGHKGTITLGLCAGSPALIFHGRIHSYEGHSKARICKQIRAMRSWGIDEVLLFNATGGLDTQYIPGELVSITHVWDATGPNWNIHLGEVSWTEIESDNRLPNLQKGRYVMVGGPSYETAAEVRGLGRMGANLVGMSSAWEIQEGAQIGMSIQLISVVANLGTGLTGNPLTHQEVCLVMSQSESQIQRISKVWLKR